MAEGISMLLQSSADRARDLVMENAAQVEAISALEERLRAAEARTAEAEALAKRTMTTAAKREMTYERLMMG
eukprot:4417732-Prymnesium_polylepis.1